MKGYDFFSSPRQKELDAALERASSHEGPSIVEILTDAESVCSCQVENDRLDSVPPAHNVVGMFTSSVFEGGEHALLQRLEPVNKFAEFVRAIARQLKAFFPGMGDADIQISMDGKGRVFDNIMIERLLRSVKYQGVYLKGYENVLVAQSSLERYFEF